jgi:hypothetical protein
MRLELLVGDIGILEFLRLDPSVDLIGHSEDRAPSRRPAFDREPVLRFGEELSQRGDAPVLWKFVDAEFSGIA